MCWAICNHETAVVTVSNYWVSLIVLNHMMQARTSEENHNFCLLPPNGLNEPTVSLFAHTWAENCNTSCSYRAKPPVSSSIAFFACMKLFILSLQTEPKYVFLWKSPMTVWHATMHWVNWQLYQLCSIMIECRIRFDRFDTVPENNPSWAAWFMLWFSACIFKSFRSIPSNSSATWPLPWRCGIPN